MKKEQVTIRCPNELKELIKKKANEMGIAMKDFILLILYQYFENTVPK